MRIIVNHLTRMQPGYICVAGVDLQTGKHVRPIGNGQLTRALLRQHGGPFDIAEIVDLGTVKHVGAPPEIEDHEFDYHLASGFAIASPDEFWDVLQQAAKQQLNDIFGPELQKYGRTCATPSGQGTASLGCLIPLETPELFTIELPDESQKLRMHFTDGVFDVRASVTDIRLYEADQKTLRIPVVDDLQRRISRGAAVILSVGLTRPWHKPEEDETYHWLQVNGIHLADNPVWQDDQAGAPARDRAAATS